MSFLVRFRLWFRTWLRNKLGVQVHANPVARVYLGEFEWLSQLIPLGMQICEGCSSFREGRGGGIVVKRLDETITEEDVWYAETYLVAEDGRILKSLRGVLVGPDILDWEYVMRKILSLPSPNDAAFVVRVDRQHHDQGHVRIFKMPSQMMATEFVALILKKYEDKRMMAEEKRRQECDEKKQHAREEIQSVLQE